jgi:hypothetical protein
MLMEPTIHDPGTLKRTMHKRGITDGVYHYIYIRFYSASNPKGTYAYPYDEGRKAMELAAASGDVAVADRLEFCRYRSPEEFNDLERSGVGTQRPVSSSKFDIYKSTCWVGCNVLTIR